MSTLFELEARVKTYRTIPMAANLTLGRALTTNYAHWRHLISFVPPVSLINSKGMTIRYHYIENARGDQINLDYYPVQVSRMPTISGNLMTPENMLIYIRRHMNNFVNTNIARFQPESDIDRRTFHSSSPLGALVHIDMFVTPGHLGSDAGRMARKAARRAGGVVHQQGVLDAPLNLEDGSVVVTEADSRHWVFSTVYVINDGDHPVSGNREFGFTRTEEGSFIFYTRAADRTTGLLESAMSSMAFAGADRLWVSFQQRLAAFINSHGGSARVGTKVHDQPDWQTIRSRYYRPTRRLGT